MGRSGRRRRDGLALRIDEGRVGAGGGCAAGVDHVGFEHIVARRQAALDRQGPFAVGVGDGFRKQCVIEPEANARARRRRAFGL